MKSSTTIATRPGEQQVLPVYDDEPVAKPSSMQDKLLKSNSERQMFPPLQEMLLTLQTSTPQTQLKKQSSSTYMQLKIQSSPTNMQLKESPTKSPIMQLENPCPTT